MKKTIFVILVSLCGVLSLPEGVWATGSHGSPTSYIRPIAQSRGGFCAFSQCGRQRRRMRRFHIIGAGWYYTTPWRSVYGYGSPGFTFGFVGGNGGFALGATGRGLFGRPFGFGVVSF